MGSKNTHFQKNDRFWSINNAPKINRRGLFECGPTPHTHGPLFQRKPHVKRHAGCLTALKSLKSPLADWAFLVRAGPRMPGYPPPTPKAAQNTPLHPQTKHIPRRRTPRRRSENTQSSSRWVHGCIDFGVSPLPIQAVIPQCHPHGCDWLRLLLHL